MIDNKEDTGLMVENNDPLLQTEKEPEKEQKQHPDSVPDEIKIKEGDEEPEKEQKKEIPFDEIKEEIKEIKPELTQQKAYTVSIEDAKMQADYLLEQYNTVVPPFLKQYIALDTVRLKQIIVSSDNELRPHIQPTLEALDTMNTHIGEVLKLNKDEQSLLRAPLAAYLQEAGAKSSPKRDLLTSMFLIGFQKYQITKGISLNQDRIFNDLKTVIQNKELKEPPRKKLFIGGTGFFKRFFKRKEKQVNESK